MKTPKSNKVLIKKCRCDMKEYIIYGETKTSDGWFTVLGFARAESPGEAFEKLKAESYWSELKDLITEPEIRIREVGDLHYVFLSSKGVPEGA